MKTRDVIISIFVIVWLVVFHYESTRAFYLEPLLHKRLPKVKFLFPPAGWIMFYNVGDSFGYAQVYGIKEGHSVAIEPHQILQTRAIGYDNIHRNALLEVLSPQMAHPFCLFLQRKFPYFDNFVVTYINYPSMSKNPFEQQQNVIYECK
jgi:hypothetical protein